MFAAGSAVGSTVVSIIRDSVGMALVLSLGEWDFLWILARRTDTGSESTSGSTVWLAEYGSVSRCGSYQVPGRVPEKSFSRSLGIQDWPQIALR